MSHELFKKSVKKKVNKKLLVIWWPVKLQQNMMSIIILGMNSAYERRCYNVRSFLIGWAHTQIDPRSDVNFEWKFISETSQSYKTSITKLYVSGVYQYMAYIENMWWMMDFILKWKHCHFDTIFVTGCSWSWQNDNFQCIHRLKFHQNDVIPASVCPLEQHVIDT